MKIKLIILALLISTSSFISAGDNRDHKGSKKSYNRLNLTEDQKVGFDAIMKNQRESMRMAREEIHEKTHTELVKILSPEQMETLQKRNDKRAKMKKKMKKRKDNRQNRRQDRQQNQELG